MKCESNIKGNARAAIEQLGGDVVRTRTIEEIEEAFREMGLTETTWGRVPETEGTADLGTTEQIFIRIETTTTPLEAKTNADLA